MTRASREGQVAPPSRSVVASSGNWRVDQGNAAKEEWTMSRGRR